MKTNEREVLKAISNPSSIFSISYFINSNFLQREVYTILKMLIINLPHELILEIKEELTKSYDFSKIIEVVLLIYFNVPLEKENIINVSATYHPNINGQALE
jgi:hypothetical protein